ncbi:MAG: prepilin-type N-terminal cleavage/methylation domain-containing protein [Patescibacteria group bacterium]|jgi:prepilin-type N-terminal cleavage/methylation domain-containing protein
MVSKKQKGFTLIEIVIVISIMALLTAITIPYLTKFQPNLKLTAAGRMLAADLRLAQQLTVTEQTVHLISLDISGDSYSLLSLGTATTTVKSVILPADVFFDSANTTVAEIRFNSYGGAAGGAAGQIQLKNTNEKFMVVNIKPSGYVELKD